MINYDQAYLDLRGLKCPLPVLKARKRLSQMRSGEKLAVVADDPLVVIDIPHFCNEAGHHLLEQSNQGDEHHFLIERG